MRKIGLVFILLFVFMYVDAQQFSARDIVNKAVKAVQLSGSESISTLTIIDNKGRERVRKMTQASKLYDNGNTEKRIILFIEPADVKGTGLLTFDYKEKDDDIWLYMPALRKTRRIVSNEQAKSFMGSEFSYSDLMPPNMNNFNFKLLSDENIDNIECYKIEMLPNNDLIASENGFSKKVSWFGKEDFVIRKSIYFNLYGEKEKELISMNIKELDKVNHRYRPMEMWMNNLLSNRKSKMIINEIVFNPDVKDEYFETSYLQK